MPARHNCLVRLAVTSDHDPQFMTNPKPTTCSKQLDRKGHKRVGIQQMNNPPRKLQSYYKEASNASFGATLCVYEIRGECSESKMQHELTLIPSPVNWVDKIRKGNVLPTTGIELTMTRLWVIFCIDLSLLLEGMVLLIEKYKSQDSFSTNRPLFCCQKNLCHSV